MRILYFLTTMALLCSSMLWADVRKQIQGDIRSRDIFSGKSFRHIAPPDSHSPHGLKQIEQWVTLSGNPIRVLDVQRTREMSILAYVCDQESSYWLRLQGTVLELNLWYGPYSFSSAQRFDPRSFRKVLQHYHNKDIPMLNPSGLTQKISYICRQHGNVTEEFVITDENIPADTRVIAYYCEKGKEYWVNVQNPTGSRWYGPYQIVSPVENFVTGISLGKRQYQEGEPVDVQVWLENKTGEGVWLQFYSGLQGDYKIDDKYQYSLTHFATMALSQKFIPPYAKEVLLSYQHLPSDYYLTSGAHTITAIVKTSNQGEFISSPVSFQVIREEISVNQMIFKGIDEIKKGNLNQARSWLLRAVAKDPKNGSAYYNLACVESLAFDTEKALEYLAKSFELGFDDFEHVERDRDLNNIRNLPRFRQIVNYYSSRRYY